MHYGQHDYTSSATPGYNFSTGQYLDYQGSNVSYGHPYRNLDSSPQFPLPQYSVNGNGALQSGQYQESGLPTSANLAYSPSFHHGHPAPNGGVGPILTHGSAGYYSSTPQPQIESQPLAEDLMNGSQINGPSQSYNSCALRLSTFAGNCTYCREPLHPSTDAPQVMCPGCGPLCNIRYCSTSCLLVDVLDHSTRCMQYPASQREIHHKLPLHVIYEQNPISPLDGSRDTSYRLRQKTFSMYCFSGQFPKLYKTLAKRFKDLPVVPGFDEKESIKKTGDYAVFRSEVTGGASRVNPNADVCFT